MARLNWPRLVKADARAAGLCVVVVRLRFVVFVSKVWKSPEKKEMSLSRISLFWMAAMCVSDRARIHFGRRRKTLMIELIASGEEGCLVNSLWSAPVTMLKASTIPARSVADNGRDATVSTWTISSGSEVMNSVLNERDVMDALMMFSRTFESSASGSCFLPMQYF